MMILHRLFPLLALFPFFFMAASSATSKELPRPLSERDADLYEQIFALQDDGEIKEAAKLITLISQRWPMNMEFKRSNMSINSSWTKRRTQPTCHR